MAQSVERSCTMLVHFDKPASASEIKEALEGNDPVAKVQALQKAIMMLLNGEQIPALFITIIRYVLPSEDHTIQKLLLLYLVSGFSALFLLCSFALSCTAGQIADINNVLQETIEKTDANGKLLPEMVCLAPHLGL